MKRILLLVFSLLLLNLFATRMAIVIAPGDFQKLELIPVKNILKKANIEYTIFSTKKGVFKDMTGTYEQKVERLISSIKVKKFDGIIIIGGMGTKKYLWNDKTLQNKVEKFYYRKKLVAAICFGPIVLVKSGILNNLRATCFKTPLTLKIFKKHHVTYMDKGVVRVQNIITSNGPKSAREFANKIVLYFNRRRLLNEKAKHRISN